MAVVQLAGGARPHAGAVQGHEHLLHLHETVCLLGAVLSALCRRQKRGRKFSPTSTKMPLYKDALTSQWARCISGLAHTSARAAAADILC